MFEHLLKTPYKNPGYCAITGFRVWALDMEMELSCYGAHTKKLKQKPENSVEDRLDSDGILVV